jgi:hypothetical protein
VGRMGSRRLLGRRARSQAARRSSSGLSSGKRIRNRTTHPTLAQAPPGNPPLTGGARGGAIALFHDYARGKPQAGRPLWPGQTERSWSPTARWSIWTGWPAATSAPGLLRLRVPGRAAVARDRGHLLDPCPPDHPRRDPHLSRGFRQEIRSNLRSAPGPEGRRLSSAGEWLMACGHP